MKRARVLGLAMVAMGAVTVGAWLFTISGRHSHPNLIFITVDTVRADHLGVYGSKTAKTPVLDALARSGALFQNAQAAVPLTGPSHATLLTGRYPPVHGVRDNVTFILRESEKTLAEHLKSAGYDTAAFIGAYPVASAFGFAQGFDRFGEDFAAHSIGSEGAERPANMVVDDALSWLNARERKAPFFAWVHLYDAHAPYVPPAPFDATFQSNPYDGEIAFVDAQIGRLLESLDPKVRANTVVAVMADHGESLGEHGEKTHGVLIYQATMHVPFILNGPGIPPGATVPERVAPIDVAPTLVALLGLQPASEFRGRALVGAIQGGRVPEDVIYGESLFGRLNCRWSPLRSIVKGNFKYVEKTNPELFDLSQDPLEAKNLVSVERERASDLRSQLEKAMAAMAPGGDRVSVVKLDAEQEERLRSLGYTGGGGGGAGALDIDGLPDPQARIADYEKLQVLLADGVRAPEHIEEARTIVAKDPGNPFAAFALGSVGYQAGFFATARRAFERSLELDPDRPNIRLQLGRLLRDSGLMAASEKEHRIAVELSGPSDIRARASFALTLVRVGKLDEAESVLNELRAKSPDHPEVLASLGHLRLAHGDVATGLELLARAVLPGDDDSAIALGAARLAAGDAAGAGEAVWPVLDRTAAHPWATALLGQARVASGARDEGFNLLLAAARAKPRRPGAWRAIAQGFGSLGEAALARKATEEADAILKR